MTLPSGCRLVDLSIDGFCRLFGCIVAPTDNPVFGYDREFVIATRLTHPCGEFLFVQNADLLKQDGPREIGGKANGSEAS